jgi:hypothetical protein
MAVVAAVGLATAVGRSVISFAGALTPDPANAVPPK